YCYLDNWFKKIFDELNILLIPVLSDKHIDDIVSLCDGLVVTGSPNDIDPKYYGQELIEGKELKFDEFPFVKNVVKAFADVHKPILGICAGIQELNVIFGGSLYQSIDGHNLRDQSMHNINLDKESFLYEVYKDEKIDVNSYHRQAIKDLAEGFKVTALSNDGIIEGIERDNIVAVQWHPEALFDVKLFKDFIDKYIK
ncbi:MAG: gamma-glutamyl-gamma-aminobutyrate hydrolase family protein, partial [Bacilli bacterium]|nr:gamma-glutamyl-gamma-aminobutyrate hydrolase family protein [Bacilli bacterium]